MDLQDQITLLTILSYTLWALGVLIFFLLVYLVIRQGVFHGLRAHTRWIDNGKDYEKLP